MTSKFNWRHAFSTSDEPATPEQRQKVINAIFAWSDWDVQSEGLWITRVEDSDGDAIWDCEYNDVDEIDHCFSSRFIEYMNNKFDKKKTVVVGAATKLPLPVASPSPSSKGAVSSSSF